jgi:glyoxylase-like metal-dependent hydrolase (beta-lactamase superfamily II)
VNATIPLDLNWAGHPRSIASALLRSQNFSALIDPGPTSTITTLRGQLALHHLSVSDLRVILLTHIHLDHAGATGSLVLENPHLKVYVHSRGAAHMADPAILLQSAGRLYGDDMQRLFGAFLPVPSENLHILNGGEILPLGSRQLSVLYTPGHASHHVTYFDATEGIAFVGDTAGICIQGHPFVLPATPPPDINIELWDASLEAISQLQPSRFFLTHYGFSDHPQRHINSYRERLHYWSDLASRILSGSPEEDQAVQSFTSKAAADASKFLSPDELSHYVFSGALHLSWLGLVRYHRKCKPSLTLPSH